LQAFWPLHDEFAILQALWPLQALTPLHFTPACAAVAKVPIANTAAAVAKTVRFVMSVSLDRLRNGKRPMRQGPACILTYATRPPPDQACEVTLW
jgi:hypothetical protein